MDEQQHGGTARPSGRPLWAGSYGEPPHPAMWSFTVSLDVDRRLWPEDVAGSRAHVRALVRAGVLDREEGALLLDGLARVAAELAAGSFAWAAADEDVHTAVERRLTELVGAAGGRLHTGRSRNDQVATDLRLWVKRATADAVAAVAGLVEALARTGAAHAAVILPGLTHLQPAQPVLWSFQLAAHGFALTRDLGRLEDAARRADVCPLGAGAIAGSSFPLDPEATAADLGFAAAFGNAMDATSDRDVVAELLAAAAIAMAHASRLAEDVALWAGRGWVVLPDAWATGSSMLPQKRNPDVAELVRGRAGTVVGRLAGFLATLKGLPLAYARDLQEDKAAVFEAVDTLTSSAGALSGLVGGLRPVPERMLAAAEEADATAVDLAEELVRGGVPFRRAHEAVGAAVRAAAAGGRRLADLTRDELAGAAPELAGADPASLSVAHSVAVRTTPGGTAPARVAEQLELLAGAAASARDRAGRLRPRLDLGLGGEQIPGPP
ncbi:MAG TPA: argininosuccinate lyase [Actinomycetes bacterium]|nr:argininosuccinate lyase [Actinomycetes bacterium]